MGDGTIINTDIINEVLNKDSGEIKICHKLKLQFLRVKGNERQKVAPAKALFSATVAKAITYFTKNERASEFFLLIDKFSDIVSSKVPLSCSDKPLKSGFGIEKYHSEQTAILNLMKKEIFELGVIGKKSLLPFRKLSSYL